MFGSTLAKRDWHPARKLWGIIYRRPAQLAAALVIVGVALPLRIFPFHGVSGFYSGGTGYYYDEGVYWASLRAMAAGGLPFSEVFSSQPPGFLLCIYPFYLLFGQTLEAARIGIIFYSLLGILATYYIGRHAGGPWAGAIACVLLALDPLYAEQSRLVQAETPSLAFMLIAVALAANASQQVGPWKRGLALSAGVALGLSIMCKVFTVVAVAPVLFYLTTPALVSGAVRADSVWPRFQVVLRQTVAPQALWFVAGILAAFLVALTPFLNAVPAVYDQAIAFHLSAEHALQQGIRYNLSRMDLIGHTRSEYWLAFAALGGALITVWRRFWTIVPLLAWFLASLLVLLRQQPLYDQHLVLLVPPLAIAAGLVLPATFHGIWPAGWTREPRYGSNARQPGLLALTWATAIAGALALLLVVYSSVPLDIRLSRQAAAPLTNEQAQLVNALRRYTSSTDLIVTDDQRIAVLAGRYLPPNLVDTSATRIKSGYLTSAGVEAVIVGSNVSGVLFASGRLDLLAGFRDWVSAHSSQEISFGQSRTLYLMPASAHRSSAGDGGQRNGHTRSAYWLAYKPVGPRAKCSSCPQNSYILWPGERPAHRSNCHQVAQTASSIDKRLLLVAPMINQRSNNKESLCACG